MFSVITMGRGLMGGYGGAIPAKDRWAIIAYLRALQKAKIDSDNKPAETAETTTNN